MATTTNRTDKILVVDDDARIRDLLNRYLTQEGFEVMVAEDGKALNRLLLRETVDLIVLDLMMPGEDGLSICRRLRAASDRTPIIMLTAKGEDVDRIVGLEVGAGRLLRRAAAQHGMHARAAAQWRRAAADHGRIRHAQGPGATPAPTPVARKARPAGARPRVRALRPKPGCAGVAPAQAGRSGRRRTTLHPDGVGRRLCFRTGRNELTISCANPKAGRDPDSQ